MSSSTVDGLGHANDSHEESYLTAQKGIMSWVFTIDHKRIGLMYLVTVLAFFMVGGLLAMGVRAELFTPEGDLFSSNTYNRVFTLHGAIMVFLVLVPAIPATMGNFFLAAAGRHRRAFPNLASFHRAGVFQSRRSSSAAWTPAGLHLRAPRTRTRACCRTPRSSSAFVHPDGLNFIDVHKMLPGMSWAACPVHLGHLRHRPSRLATPVIAITPSCSFERTGIGIFDPALGGDLVLFQHFFWF